MSTADNRQENSLISVFLHLLRERLRSVGRSSSVAAVLEEGQIDLENDTLYLGVVFPEYVRHSLGLIEEAARQCWGLSISVEVEELREPAEPLAEPPASETSGKPSTSPGAAAPRSSGPKAAATTSHVPPAQPNRAARRRAQHNLAEIERTLRRFCRDVIEIGALKVAPRGITVAGYFDANHLAEAAKLLTNRDAQGFYITLNPPKHDLLSRAENRLVERPDSVTSDADIDRCEWLFLDFDPKRPSGISATDTEKSAAAQRAEECRQHFAEFGWVAPLVADSGNGRHLLYPIALPNDNDSRILIERVLKSLALTLSDDFVRG